MLQGSKNSGNSIAVLEMQSFLSKSLASVNQNKVNGILAEIEFRNYLKTNGYSGRVSAGGWIVRNTGSNFSHHVVAFSRTRYSPEGTTALA